MATSTDSTGGARQPYILGGIRPIFGGSEQGGTSAQDWWSGLGSGASDILPRFGPAVSGRSETSAQANPANAASGTTMPGPNPSAGQDARGWWDFNGNSGVGSMATNYFPTKAAAIADWVARFGSLFPSGGAAVGSYNNGGDTSTGTGVGSGGPKPLTPFESLTETLKTLAGGGGPSVGAGASDSKGQLVPTTVGGSKSPAILIVAVLIAGALAFYWYKKHGQKAAAE